jgi:hypothetical protein
MRRTRPQSIGIKSTPTGRLRPPRKFLNHWRNPLRRSRSSSPARVNAKARSRFSRGQAFLGIMLWKNLIVCRSALPCQTSTRLAGAKCRALTSVTLAGRALKFASRGFAKSGLGARLYITELLWHVAMSNPDKRPISRLMIFGSLALVLVGLMISYK